jgi:LacI family transcriptional regulator
MMTIQKLAKICGVSPATVSRAIRGQAPVSAETRQRINRAITEHNYSPRPAKQTRTSEKSGIIGVILPAMDHPFAQFLLWEIQNQINRFQKTLMIIPERGNGLSKHLHKIALEGIILISAEIEQETISLLKQSGRPVIMCSVLSLTNVFSSVRVDDLAAAYDGAHYLLDLGHRKIGFITDSPRSIDSGFQRIVGCRKAMEDFGIPPDDRMFFSGTCDYDSGFAGADKLVTDNPGMTALFAHSDISALGAIAALSDKGFRVPGDVSVLGFDDIQAGERNRPRLTTVHQPVSDIVEKSLELLIRDTEHHNGGHQAVSIVLKHRITVRDSCRKL